MSNISDTTRTRHADSGRRGGNGAAETRQHPAAKKNYDTAVARGLYERDLRGMEGKYDNVRRYWEDQITRYALRPFVEPLVGRKRRELSRIRVVDLGAGAGEGYEILSGMKNASERLPSQEVALLPAEIIAHYHGIDISEAMVEQGNAIYESNPKVHFSVGDLSAGLGEVRREPPFDIYFSSYSSLSHLSDEGLRVLAEDVCDHYDGCCVLVADMMGRYSVEWQCYWDQPGTDASNMRQYSMSYLYPAEMLHRIEVERFPMRYWGADEFDHLMTRAIESKGSRVARRQIWDRSIIVGRHMNTAEYNPQVRPIRSAVNSLYVMDQRTDLSALLFDYVPHADFPELNGFFDRFQMAWNTVVYEAIAALEQAGDADLLAQPPAKEYPEIVREAITTIRNVVRGVHWFRMGDPRANIVEPQLGYVLRNLEMDLQQGLGAGHGFLALYELQKGR